MKNHLYLLLIACCTPLTGCVSVGETAIRANRTLYNEAIHDTSNQQLLLNIVRARHFDTPTFLTAVEIDGTNTATASVAGGPSLISVLGATTVGAMTGTATISDSPISKYQTLAGAELISQVSLPISAQSISKLATSDWPATPLITLTIERFTPEFLDYYKAVTLIDYFNRFGAISFASTGPNDLSMIFHRNGNVRAGAIQPDDKGDVSTQCPELQGIRDKDLQKLWAVLKAAMGENSSKLPQDDKIFFGDTADPKGKTSNSGHPLYTYSAYGALRLAEHDTPIFVVHSAEAAQKIRIANKSYKDESNIEVNFCANGDFYYVENIDSDQQDVAAIQNYWRKEAILVKGLLKGGSDSAAFRALGHHRAFIVLIESPAPIVDAFVAIQSKGRWYSIDDSDSISKRNFLLLNQILTIQAVSSPSPPTQTTISKAL